MQEWNTYPDLNAFLLPRDWRRSIKWFPYVAIVRSVCLLIGSWMMLSSLPRWLAKFLPTTALARMGGTG